MLPWTVLSEIAERIWSPVAAANAALPVAITNANASRNFDLIRSPPKVGAARSTIRGAPSIWITLR